MDSSNVDVVTTGDVEDGRHIPNWFVDHKLMLHPNQEGEANKLGYFILKVPEYYRQPPTAFTPRGWRVGLHNRENLDNTGSEAIKLGIAIQYGLVGEKWDHFCDAIVDDPKAMLACYGLQKGLTSWTDEQIKHVLALDALFLAHYFDMFLPRNERQLEEIYTSTSQFSATFHRTFLLWFDIVRVDLYRVENQVPLILIDKVVGCITNFISSPTSEDSEPFVDALQYQQKIIEYIVNKRLAESFMDTTGEVFKIDNAIANSFSLKTHILGAAYEVICGSKGLLMERMLENAYIHVPSATKLEQSGIKLVGVDGPLCTISYNKKCLYLPKMRIYDDTISFIRNMAWYERKSIRGGCLFNNYIDLLCDLIQAPEDIYLLTNCGIIDNGCGIRAFGMWKAMDEGMGGVSSSQMYHDMKVDIKSRCDRRRYRLWNEFKIVFCSKPWFILSTIAVVLVTMATLVQTYIAIIGSNKMKPKFP